MVTIEEHVRKAVAAAPPLSDEQRERIAALLGGPKSPTPPPQRVVAKPIKSVALYRHFDREGQLLYVGISKRFPSRTSEHAAHSSWFDRFVVRADAEFFPTRSLAEVAERTAIQAEAPIFNKQHSDTQRDERAVQYLIDHGASDLLKPTV